MNRLVVVLLAVAVLVGGCASGTDEPRKESSPQKKQGDGYGNY